MGRSMNSERQLINFITELIKKTINKEISWKKIKTPLSLREGTDNIISLCFETNYDNTTFIVFQRKYQNYNFDFDTLYWTEEYKLGILDQDTVTWENPDTISSIKDLFIQVQQKVSGIEKFINN